MRHCGIMKLSQSHRFCALKLAAMFPDEGEWLMKLYRRTAYKLGRNNVTAADVAKACNYKGPIELLSLELCFASDGALGNCHIQELKDNMKSILAKCHEYKVEHQQWPHPAIALTLRNQSS